MRSPRNSIVFLSLLAGLTEVNAAFVTGFESPTYNHSFQLAGQDGWTINDPVPDVSNFAFWNGSYAGLLGGIYSAPNTTQVALSHPFSAPAGGVMFDVDFLVQDVVGSPHPQRDSFGWSFQTTGPGDVFRVAFEPTGIATQLEIAWYDNANVRHTLLPTSQDILYRGNYHLSVDFTDSGPNLGFTASITGTNTVTWTDSLVGAGGQNLTSFAAEWNLSSVMVSEAGDNFMIFDGLSIIPEPSTSFLSAGFVACLLFRRKRS